MRTHQLLLFTIGIWGLMSSCANYRMHIKLPDEVQTTPPTAEPEFTMFLVGDAGYAASDSISPALTALRGHLEKAPAKSTVMFLGDNIYPNGLPSREDPDRVEAERRLRLQLDILKNFKGTPFFIPGNHDWRRHVEGVRREEEFIETYLNRGDVWRPSNACGDPEVWEINDQLVVVFVDSHWWLANWNKEPEINAGCEVQSRKNFLIAFEEIIKKHRHKNIVIALHHPPYTNGPHGGRYSFKQHVFPLTDFKPNLYVPLPVVGTFFAFLRGTIGSTQDNPNPKNKSLMKGLLGSAQKNGSYIFVSGHEHNLQYFENDEQSFIVSGSGSKTSPASMGRGAQFAYGARGFSIIKFYKDGSAWVEFWVGDYRSPEGRLVFTKQIKKPLQGTHSQLEKATDTPVVLPASKLVAIDPSMLKKKFHRFVWGNHYRAVYFTPFEAPVLDLSTMYGGLVPVKRGGGYQTSSLRLQAANGKQYVMRALLKDASHLLPYPYNHTVAKDIFADQFSAAHPFAAMALTDMAQAAGIYHTNPHIFFVPRQPALGAYSDSFGDKLYLFEERPSGDWRDADFFGRAKNIIDTQDLIKKRNNNYKTAIDEPFTVRARLFDMLVGDWDRHDDQWRWAASEPDSAGFVWYRPIPRDRDQAFHKYDGLVISLLRNSIPFFRQLRVFQPDVKNTKWINYNARHFDQTFLTGIGWPYWEAETRRLQQQLTDSIIAQSMTNMPVHAFELTGKGLIEKVEGRRNRLMDIARDHYELLARKVDIVGTHQDDIFVVERLDNERTVVRVFHADSLATTGRMFFERTFFTTETKEIRLYALEGNDLITIAGKTHKGILVRAIGGLGSDTFIDSSKVKGWSKKTKIYDNRLNDNHFSSHGESNIILSNDPVMNIYDRKAPEYEYDYTSPYPRIGFNPDDGLMLGGGIKSLRYGFKKSPYAAQHTLAAHYAFATSGFGIKYKGEFIGALRKCDILLNSKIQGPLFTINYFGLGNNTPVISNDREDFDYNRVRQSLVGLYPSIRVPLGEGGSISMIAKAEATKIENTPGRFVGKPEAMVPQEAFSNNYFGGSELRLDYKNVDQEYFPTMGIDFSGGISWITNLSQPNRQFTCLDGHFSFYLGSDKIVLASSVGGKKVHGDFLFYQAATIGGDENLRGFRNERFAGNTAFYHNTDLRIRLGKLNNYYFPLTIGLFGGFDYGRIWLEGEYSNLWHQSYGGGFWLSPFETATANLSLFHSSDGYRFTVGSNFMF